MHFFNIIRSSKIVVVCILCLSLFIATFFFSGGEDPEDAVADIITAIETNDVALFNSRVPREFWSSIDDYLGQRPKFNDVFRSAIGQNQFLADNILSGRQSIWVNIDTFSYFMQGFVSNQITSGNLANLSRTADVGFLPFAPELLENLTYTDENIRFLEGIITTEITLPSGQKSFLAFNYIDDKYYLLGQASTARIAMMRANKLAQTILGRFEDTKIRTENANIYEEDFTEQQKTLAKLIAQGKFEEAERLRTKTVPFDILSEQNLLKTFKLPSVISYSNNYTIWQNVQECMIANFPVITNYQAQQDAQYIEYLKQDKAHFSDGVDQRHFTLGEVVFQKDDMVLIKYYEFTKKEAFTQKEKDDLRTNWLNYYAIPNHKIYYSLIKEENDLWVSKAFAVGSENDSTLRLEYAYPLTISKGAPDPAIELYFENYAERYKEIEKNVSDVVAP